MANDVLFKTKMFGGFCKDDVMTYIDRLLAEKSSLGDQLSSANANIARLNANVAVLTGETAAVDALKSEVTSLKAQIDSMQHEVDSCRELETKLSLLNAENASLKEQLDNERSAAGSAGGEVQNLRAENAALRAECGKVRDMEAHVGAAMLDARLHSEELVKDAREKANQVTREIYSAIGDTALKIDGLSTGIDDIARSFSKAVEEVELRINVLTGNMSKTAQALLAGSFLPEQERESVSTVEGAFTPIKSDAVSEQVPEKQNASGSSFSVGSFTTAANADENVDESNPSDSEVEFL